MRLRAQIMVELSAEDFVEAADHQHRLAEFLGDLKRVYPNAELTIRERRERKPERIAVPVPEALRSTGVRQAKIG